MAFQQFRLMGLEPVHKYACSPMDQRRWMTSGLGDTKITQYFNSSEGVFIIFSRKFEYSRSHLSHVSQLWFHLPLVARRLVPWCERSEFVKMKFYCSAPPTSFHYSIPRAVIESASKENLCSNFYSLKNLLTWPLEIKINLFDAMAMVDGDAGKKTVKMRLNFHLIRSRTFILAFSLLLFIIIFHDWLAKMKKAIRLWLLKWIPLSVVKSILISNYSKYLAFVHELARATAASIGCESIKEISLVAVDESREIWKEKRTCLSSMKLFTFSRSLYKRLSEI